VRLRLEIPDEQWDIGLRAACAARKPQANPSRKPIDPKKKERFAG
jgi:hypothetical protein